MIRFLDPFGYQVSGKTIGEMWLSLVALIVKRGRVSFDESRKRVAIQNVRIKSLTQKTPDKLIRRFGNQKNLKAMLKMTFAQEKMSDIDVVPSFSPGANSYYQRIKDGQLMDFVIKRLSKIPESKKAAIVFPTFDDYRSVLKKPKDDYLPCMISIQFRLHKKGSKYVLDTTAYFRSIDAFQKAHGNFVAIVMLSHKAAKGISANLKTKVTPRYFDGLIADAHIYWETFEEAAQIVRRAKIR